MTQLYAELGINHQGRLDIALLMIQRAKRAGADLVKFQMKTPRLSTPADMWKKSKTWQGQEMTYIEYKELLELSEGDYVVIDSFCKKIGIPWAASVWDIPALKRLMKFDVPLIKIPSAKLTDLSLVKEASRTGLPVVLSTGMSTIDEIKVAVSLLNINSMLMHCNAAYPASDAGQNLRVIPTLQDMFEDFQIGFSSHSKSPYPALYAAAIYNVEAVEVHYTLDRSWEGTDHASSLEDDGIELLRREFDRIPVVLGSSEKKVLDEELPFRLKLRGY